MSVRAVPVPRTGRIQGPSVATPRPLAIRKFTERMADDRDLIEVKLVILAGLALLAMATEFYL